MTRVYDGLLMLGIVAIALYIITQLLLGSRR